MPETLPKKLHVRSWGCQMNAYDAERVTGLMRPLGYQATDDPAEADLVVLNTCHIREKAAEKVYSDLGRLRRATKPGAKVAVAGCVAQAEGAEIAARAPNVDIVVGPQSLHRLPELVARAHREEGLALHAEFEAEAKFDALEGERDVTGVAAFVTAQEGCDKFCTFCVVPYTRGAEVNRPAAAILSEVRTRWRSAACARSRCSARTSTRGAGRDRAARPGASARSAAASRACPASSGSASPPATPPTWTTS